MSPLRLRWSAAFLFSGVCPGEDVTSHSPVPATIEVHPGRLSLLVGQIVTVKATVRDAGGVLLPDAKVTWTSSDTRVADVSGGIVRGIGQGTASISAEVGLAHAEIPVTASLVPVTTVSISPVTSSVLVGRTLGLTVELRDSAGGMLSGRSLVWSSDRLETAEVSNTGVVMGRAQGTAVISASVEQTSGTAQISVIQPGAIAFSRNVPTGNAVFLMKPDGSDQIQASQPIARVTDPAWSPDGSRIAYGDGAIHVMEANGINDFALTVPPYDVGDADPAWAPDGRRLAFTRGGTFLSPATDIYLIRADGTREVRLTTLGDADAPAWAPDGSVIAFVRGLEPFNPSTLGVWLLDPETGTVMRLTNQAASQPAWSPDGSKIAFTAASPTGRPALWLMNANGSDRRQLTAPKTDTGFLNPAWSPDGARLAFSIEGTVGPAGIGTIRSDGTDRVALTDTPGDSHPSWRP